MCAICGCGASQDHSHRHDHDHGKDAGESRRIAVEQDLLAKNDAFAARNRDYLTRRRILTLNLVSSPGSGKTTLLVRTIQDLADRFPISVIEGDQQTSVDAERIRATGAMALQINTGKGCHLDAHQVGHALERVGLKDDGLLFIENVGNLVCPAAFDLGEAAKVVMLSVTEGDDKPLKYPDMFSAADLMLVTKTDLSPYVNFNAQHCEAYARRVNPNIEIISLSATDGGGLHDWYAWIDARSRALRASRAEAETGDGI